MSNADKPQNYPHLSEDQVDELLSTFFKSEVPEKLNTPPSAWAQLRNPARANVATVGNAGSQATAPSSGRGIVVAIASLAACLTLMAVTDFGPSKSNTPQQIVDQIPAEDIGDTTNLMNVSEAPEAQATQLNDEGLSIEELEIELDDPTTDSNKKPSDMKQPQ